MNFVELPGLCTIFVVISYINMNTRKLSLPLVILAALSLGNPVFAQSVAHSPLFAYLQDMPEPPSFPDDATLISTPPAHFEDHGDLNALQKNLEAIVNGPASGGGLGNPQMEYAKFETAPGTGLIHADESMSMKQTNDTMMLKLKEVQAVRIEFQENFRRLENTYSKNIEKVYEASRVLQKEKPCDGNTGCLQEHARLLNSGVIAATREKIVSEEYLLSVYLARVKPSFKSVDDILAGNGYGDGIRSKEIKTLFCDAQHNELLLLTDIIERLKIERITISNCARLAQQYQKK